DAPSTAVQEQVGSPQRLFEPLPLLCTASFLSHCRRWIDVKTAEAECLAGEVLCLSRPVLPRSTRRHGLPSTLRMQFASRPDQEWPYRRHASVRADVANHVLALAFCSRNPGCEFF